MSSSVPFVTLQSRRPADSSSLSSRDSTVRRGAHAAMPAARRQHHLTHLDRSQYGSSAGDDKVPPATHDTSRVNFHVRDIQHFAESLEGVGSPQHPALSTQHPTCIIKISSQPTN